MNNPGFRLRISYGKTGRLRHLSHLELTRALERLVRRAQLPYVLTEGFHARMKCAFCPALPVGTAGYNELLDVWLESYLSPSDVLRRLRGVTVPDIPINHVSYCAHKAPSLQASHVLSGYEAVITVSNAQVISLLEQAFAELLLAGNITVMKKGAPKRVDLDDQIYLGPVITSFDEGGLMAKVALVLRACEQTSIRPDALLKAALDTVEGARLVEVIRVMLEEEPQGVCHAKHKN